MKPAFCPIAQDRCVASACAWFCKDEGKCAIALIPSTLDWLTRFAVTKPYENTEESEL